MPDTSPSPSSPANATGIALGASIAAVVVLIAGGLIVILLRRRRRAFAQLHDPAGPAAGRPSVTLDRLHPASRVTPFTPGREQDGPRFTHRPGEAMRIARRRSDGGWDFSSPLPSLSLHSLHSLAAQSPLSADPSLTPPTFPSPFRDSTFSSSSACSSPTMSSITLIGTAGKGGKGGRDSCKKVQGELTTRGFVEPESDIDMLPPPAYSPNPSPRRGSHGYSLSSRF